MEPDTPSEVRGPRAVVRSCLAAGFPPLVRAWLGAVVVCFGLTASVRAALQFDVFIGYGGRPSGFDGIVREAGGVPGAGEGQNDCPPFNAAVEVAARQIGRGQSRRTVGGLAPQRRERHVVGDLA